MAKSRNRTGSDADRRVRQCERISRVLRVLHCIMGPGRWDAEALALELECSVRTIHRDLQTLSMSGVPFRFDQDAKAYRVRAGLRFPGVDRATSPPSQPELPSAAEVLPHARELLRSTERFLEALKTFCRLLESPQS